MTGEPAERASALTKLRSRKIVQWGIAYVAVAWGLLQGLQFLTQAFDWPSRVVPLSTVALALGLPIVLVTAWYHGDRHEQRVTRAEIAVLVLLFLVGGAVFWRYARESETPAGTGRTAAQSTTTAATPLDAPAAPDEKSIAVLPFVDMSAAKDQEYMSDGIAEELLNLLAKVPDLKVIARTSSFAFKGEKTDIAEIAKKLNVAHVLEGSVRTSGNKLRITAQLIRTADSTHLWSETYDRNLDDIFAIQDEIASAIVQALQIKFKGGALERREGGTHNLEAYELYLRGLSALNENTKSSLVAAGEYAERAIKLDPNYGKAWLLLGNTVSLETDNGFLDATEGYQRARQLAQHALLLSPNLAEAHSMLGYLYRNLDWHWDAAATEGQRALAIDPTNPDALLTVGLLSYTLGRWGDAERKIRAALVRSPVDPYLIFNLGMVYYGAGRFAEAEAQYRHLLDLAPTFPWTRPYLGKVLLLEGKHEEALAIVQQEADEASRLLYLPAVLQAAGHQVPADEALKTLIEKWADTAAFYVAQNYAYRGDHDLALEWLERAYRQKDASLVEIVGEPLFKSMADDSRYKAFLRKMKLPEEPLREEG